jgi:ribosome maturation factor RimP
MRLDTTIEKELEDLVADEGLDLVATEVSGSGPKTVLRLVVDGPDGVTVDQCASVSRQASAILDVSDPIQHNYTLEVTSPGLDRKLYNRSDYEKFSGRRVKIRMKPSYRAHRVVLGDLLGLEDDAVHIRSDADGELSLPLDEVFEARLEIDWNDVMKKGNSRP